MKKGIQYYLAFILILLSSYTYAQSLGMYLGARKIIDNKHYNHNISLGTIYNFAILNKPFDSHIGLERGIYNNQSNTKIKNFLNLQLQSPLISLNIFKKKLSIALGGRYSTLDAGLNPIVALSLQNKLSDQLALNYNLAYNNGYSFYISLKRILSAEKFIENVKQFKDSPLLSLLNKKSMNNSESTVYVDWLSAVVFEDQYTRSYSLSKLKIKNIDSKNTIITRGEAAELALLTQKNLKLRKDVKQFSKGPKIRHIISSYDNSQYKDNYENYILWSGLTTPTQNTAINISDLPQNYALKTQLEYFAQQQYLSTITTNDGVSISSQNSIRKDHFIIFISRYLFDHVSALKTSSSKKKTISFPLRYLNSKDKTKVSAFLTYYDIPDRLLTVSSLKEPLTRQESIEIINFILAKNKQ